MTTGARNRPPAECVDHGRSGNDPRIHHQEKDHDEERPHAFPPSLAVLAGLSSTLFLAWHSAAQAELAGLLGGAFLLAMNARNTGGGEEATPSPYEGMMEGR